MWVIHHSYFKMVIITSHKHYNEFSCKTKFRRRWKKILVHMTKTVFIMVLWSRHKMATKRCKLTLLRLQGHAKWFETRHKMTTKTHKTTIKTCEPTTERQNVHIDKHDRREMPNNYKDTKTTTKRHKTTTKRHKVTTKRCKTTTKRTQCIRKRHKTTTKAINRPTKK